MSSPTLSSAPSSRARLAIVWGGIACGVLDITAAFIVGGHYGLKPMPLLQGIAAGVLGSRAWQGGLPTAALGLLCHFFIAFSVAAFYYAIGRRLPLLVKHTLVSGALYGVAVYFFMNRIVVPLSAARKHPFTVKMMLIGVTIHIFCVGLPVAGAVRRFGR